MLQDKSPNEQPTIPVLSLQMSFTLSNFEEIIRHNFETIQAILQQQQQSINRLQLISSQQPEVQPPQKQQPIEEFSLNPQNHKKSMPHLSQEDHQNQISIEPIINIHKTQPSKQQLNLPLKDRTIQGSSGTCRRQSQVQIQVDMSHLKEPPTLTPVETPVEIPVQERKPLTLNPRQVGLNITVQETQYINPSVVLNIENSEYENKREGNTIENQNKKYGNTIEYQFEGQETPAFNIQGMTIPEYQVDGKMLESKIFELFERVRQLQQKELHHAHIATKNMKQFEHTVEENTRTLEKHMKAVKQNEEEIEKLRNELSEYKLKKQAKLNKLIHSSAGNGTQNSNETFDYIAEKIQLLLKAVKESLTKKQFEDEREVLQTGIDVLRKKLNQKVSETYMKDSLKNIEAKVYNTVIKYVKAQFIKNNKGQDQQISFEEQQKEMNKIVEQSNRDFNQRVSLQSQKIEQISERFQLLKQQQELQRKQKIKNQQDVKGHIRDIIENEKRLQHRIRDDQKDLQQFKQKTIQKQLDSQNQIIELQEQVEKMESHIKTYSYSQPESKSSVLPRNKQLLEGQQYEDQNLQQTSLMEQEIAILKKKIGKLTLKHQSLKEDIQSMRQDIIREIDGLKMNTDKKADWDSLKKSLSYFEEKLKEVKVIIEHLYNSEGKGQGDESLAVKKGWTCLMCDRSIQQYEGKLSELKFTSQFPVRESPRIGGYYKQQLVNQQYKQVFLNHRSKRNSSLKSNQSNPSKEDLVN